MSLGLVTSIQYTSTRSSYPPSQSSVPSSWSLCSWIIHVQYSFIWSHNFVISSNLSFVVSLAHACCPSIYPDPQLHAMHSIQFDTTLLYTMSVVVRGSLSLRLPILLLLELFSAPPTSPTEISPWFPYRLADRALDSLLTLTQQHPHLLCNNHATNKLPDPIHIKANILLPTSALIFNSGCPPSTFCMMKNITVAIVVAATVNRQAKNPMVPMVKPTQHDLVFGRRFSERRSERGRTRK